VRQPERPQQGLFGAAPASRRERLLAPVGVLCMELAAPATGACGARAVMVTRRRHSDAGEGMGWEGNRLRAQKAARVLKKGVNVFWDLALTAARS
jgi:hypothetical protein